MAPKKEYKKGADSAIVLDYGKPATQTVIKGITGLTPPGFEKDSFSIEELRQEFAREFNGSGKYSTLSFDGYLVTNDTLGQQRLKEYCRDNRALTGGDLVCFLDYNDFYTTDLASDPESALQVGGVSSGSAGKNAAYPISGTLRPNGQLALYTAHAKWGADLVFVKGTSTEDTITCTTGDFVEAGFVAGQTVLIFGSTVNNAVATKVKTVAAKILTLVSKGVVTSGNGVAPASEVFGTEIHGGSL